MLDHLEYGIYIKERKLFEKNGTLNARFSGIFEWIGDEESRLEVKGDERYYLIDIDEGDIVETNGMLKQSKEKALLIWPKDQKIISYKITKTYDDPIYSITNLYQDWLKIQ